VLVNLKTILLSADSEKTAVGSFNVYSYETIHGVCKAVEETKKPAIISFGASYIKNMSLECAKAIVDEAVKELPADTALHLDHCRDIKIIKNAIDAGFTSVMYDGSALSFEENVENTRAVVNMAHEKNVSVEAELGKVALGAYSNETDIDDGQAYTEPEKAAEFADKTGIDALAVSIGTVHGLYTGTPKIRVDILKEINRVTDVPLVLHGGSGTPEDILIDCISNGICKINVNTEISHYTVEKILEAIKSEPSVHLSKLTIMEADFVSQVVRKYIKLFNKNLL